MSCENCSKGFVLPGEPAGSIRADFDGAYLAECPPEQARVSTKRAVIVLTDAFGLPLANSKLIADHISKSLACDVWVPDIFNGDPLFDAEKMGPLIPDRASVPFSIGMKLRMAVSALPRLGAFYRNRAAVVDPRILAFIDKVRQAKKYEKVGAVGYCFGGACAVRLGSHPSALDSIVVCHPGTVSIAEISAIKTPASWACAEADFTFGPELRNQAEQIFAQRKDKADFVDYEFVVHKGTAHGYACRPNLGVPEVKEGYEKTLQQTIEWFEKTLSAGGTRIARL